MIEMLIRIAAIRALGSIGVASRQAIPALINMLFEGFFTCIEKKRKMENFISENYEYVEYGIEFSPESYQDFEEVRDEFGRRFFREDFHLILDAVEAAVRQIDTGDRESLDIILSLRRFMAEIKRAIEAWDESDIGEYVYEKYFEQEEDEGRTNNLLVWLLQKKLVRLCAICLP